MAPPIVNVFDKTVFVNSTIPASELFSISGDVETYLFEDFQDRAQSGYFSLNGVAYDNGARFTIAAADLGGLSYVGGPNITYEGFRVVAYNALGESSNPQAVGRIYSTRANTTAPHVLAPRFEVVANETVPGSAFISGNDPDGFPMESFTITEGSKILNMVASGGFVTVTSYKHNFSTSDSITIRGANEAAFNTTAFVAVLDEHRFRFMASVPDGVATGGSMLAAVNEAGGFYLNGVKMTSGIPFTITPDQIGQLEYAGAGLDDFKNIHLSGFDGALHSYEKRGEITTRNNANAPVVQYGRAETPADQHLPLAPEIDVVDADGSSVKGYRFFNTSPHPGNGDIFIYGVRQPKVQWLHVDAQDLGGVTFQTPRVGFDQQIRVRAYDGKFWSGIATISVTSTAPIIRPGIEQTVEPIVSEQQKSIDASSLFDKSDVGPVHTRWEVYEPSTLPNSGQLRDGPTPLTAGEIHQFTTSEFNSNVTFLTGDFYDRQVDTVYARVTNDESSDWSAWQKVDVNTEPEIEDGLTSGTSWNGILPRNSAGKLEISYSFMQQFPTYPTGEATDGDDPLHFKIFNEAQRITAREWFRHTEEFANVQFVEMADSDFNILGQQGGIIRMAEYGVVVPGGAGAFAFYPSTAPQGGDIWFNRQPPGSGPEFRGWPGPFINGFNADDYSGYTFVHELGHALGMKHSFDGIPRFPEDSDASIFTVMSYTTPLVVDAGPPFSFYQRYPGSYGMYDMYELQQLYGANTDFNTGNDTYSIANTWQRDIFSETIWDGGGIDTLSAVGSLAAEIDLRQGQQSSIGAGPLFGRTDFLQGDFKNNVTIAYGAQIENGIGSGFDDEMIGNELDNVLVGHGGNDRLFGSTGNDFLLGSSGDDTYLWGVGDHNDVINEQGNGDAADQISLVNFPTLNRIEDDLRFTMQGNDLLINLHLDGGPLESTLKVKNQTSIPNQVETLVLNGVRIDLVDLTSQVALGVDTFKTTGTSSANGALVMPV